MINETNMKEMARSKREEFLLKEKKDLDILYEKYKMLIFIELSNMDISKDKMILIDSDVEQEKLKNLGVKKLEILSKRIQKYFNKIGICVINVNKGFYVTFEEKESKYNVFMRTDFIFIYLIFIFFSALFFCIKNI